jgi:hypothetical protein
MAQSVEQRLATHDTNNALHEHRLDQHDIVLEAIGADIRWTKKILYLAVGALLGIAPVTTATAVVRLLGV